MLKEKLFPKVQQLMELQDRPDPNKFFGSQEMYILIGGFLIIAFVFFFWAKFIRKPRPATLSISSSGKPAQILNDPRDRQNKVRRRRWKKRNPTLAETGGLPPAKNKSSDA